MERQRSGRWSNRPLARVLALAAFAAACGGPASSPAPGSLETSRDALARGSGGSSLSVAPNPVVSRAAMRVAGCGYAAGGSVTVNDSGPAGARSWTATADASGCVASDAAAADPGSHTVKTYQQLKRGGQPTLVAQASFTVLPAPLGVTDERYSWRWDATKNCVSEDDTLDWSASGSLGAGQSFSFTPRYPDCNTQRAVMVQITAEPGALLELSTVVPENEYLSNDLGQKGTTIVAASSGGVARLCMFPNFAGRPSASYTITVRNVGSTAASAVSVTGKDRNDWLYFYWNDCVDADADHDGWSDAYEHAMAQLVYPTGNYNDGSLPAGTNYLRACGTPLANDEFDTWPPDLDDDGVVTQADIDLVTAHVGEGNGIPWSVLSPNPGFPDSFKSHTGAWNRFDLNADGWVDSKDVDIVRALLGKRCGG